MAFQHVAGQLHGFQAALGLGGMELLQLSALGVAQRFLKALHQLGTFLTEAGVVVSTAAHFDSAQSGNGAAQSAAGVAAAHTAAKATNQLGALIGQAQVILLVGGQQNGLSQLQLSSM